jgi:transcriptional regulator
MYQPEHFKEARAEEITALILHHPLGLLVSHGPHGLEANAIPFQLYQEDGSRHVLRCHVARANQQWKHISAGGEVLVVFQGPQHYIHPGWYETKKETGKVVPTWNYMMAQARGHARAVEDAAWLAKQIRDLTDMMESRYPKAWSVDDAPASFIEAQIRGIVGIEIEVTSMTGKWKVSQNRSAVDRRGVITGLAECGNENALAVADHVARKLDPN